MMTLLWSEHLVMEENSSNKLPKRMLLQQHPFGFSFFNCAIGAHKIHDVAIMDLTGIFLHVPKNMDVIMLLKE